MLELTIELTQLILSNHVHCNQTVLCFELRCSFVFSTGGKPKCDPCQDTGRLRLIVVLQTFSTVVT